jgi:ketosteroid isomerase-like protein
MKRTSLFFLIVFLLFAACQQTREPVSVDLEVEKVAINEVMSKFDSASLNKDLATMEIYMTEDLTGCGSDPDELWEKNELMGIWKQMFDSGASELDFFGDRYIKVAPDGKSATVFEHYFMPAFSEVLPFRNSYHMLKTKDGWKIFFFNCAIIPENEDLPAMNELLSAE